MKKIIAWFKTSNRWKHLCGGLLVGLLANGWYCALYTGVAVGCALELKDRLWGGKWDWIDCGLTVLGGTLGYAVRALVIALIWTN